MDLNQAFNIPLQKGGNVTIHNLHQQGLEKPKAPAGSDLVNLKNMGYEGEFYFGTQLKRCKSFSTLVLQLLGFTLKNVRTTIALFKTKSTSNPNLVSSIITIKLDKSSNTEEVLSLDTHQQIDSASPKAKITASTTSLS